MKIQLTFFTLMAGHTHGSYNLVLKEVDGIRKLPIIVGTFEAQSIATEIEGISPQRPLTHDLMVAMLNGLEVELKEVLIYDLRNGVFFARLILSKAGLTYDIDARTSDAVAIAIRTKSPIFIEEHLMQEIGIDEKEFQSTSTNVKPANAIESNDYTQYTRAQLKSMLEQAVEAENYVKAALIRDELNKNK